MCLRRIQKNKKSLCKGTWTPTFCINQPSTNKQLAIPGCLGPQFICSYIISKTKILTHLIWTCLINKLPKHWIAVSERQCDSFICALFNASLLMYINSLKNSQCLESLSSYSATSKIIPVILGYPILNMMDI